MSAKLQTKLAELFSFFLFFGGGFVSFDGIVCRVRTIAHRV